jgi:N-formylglutamate amidohydrolase
MRADGSQGFSVQNADHLKVPVLISIPHAGRDYPAEIFGNLRIAPSELLRLEDRYVDLLARQSAECGFPVITAHRARAWIDLNRDEADIDIEMVSGLPIHGRPTPGAKQRGGLGLIPRRLSGSGDIWKHPISAEDLTRRIVSYHRPYHDAVAALLGRMRDKFGTAVLLDLHSMPSIEDVQFVVGDRFGQSAANRFSELLLSRLRDQGFEAALNHPYSGEYILRRHGDGGHGIHAIQLEVDRSLYLDSSLYEPGNAVADIGALVLDLARILVDEVMGQQTLLAAE